MSDITWTKLNSGEWGLRVTGRGSVEPGDTVAVTSKTGKTELKTINKVVWSGNGVILCAIEQDKRIRLGSGRRGGRRCPECGGPNPYGDPCAEPCD